MRAARQVPRRLLVVGSRSRRAAQPVRCAAGAWLARMAGQQTVANW